MGDCEKILSADIYSDFLKKDFLREPLRKRVSEREVLELQVVSLAQMQRGCLIGLAGCQVDKTRLLGIDVGTRIIRILRIEEIVVFCH